MFGADGADVGTFAIPNPVDMFYRDGMMVIGTKFGFAIVNPADGVPQAIVGTVGKADDQFDNVNGVTIGR